MSLSPTYACRETPDDGVEWLDPTALRWPYLAFDRDTVADGGLPAVCRTRTGALWEFDGRRFLLTDVIAGFRRRTADDMAAVPTGPWRHLPTCACEACRLADV